MSDFHTRQSLCEELSLPEIDGKGIRLLLKRDDLLDPLVSGNKWRKLKYNLFHLRDSQMKGIVTFGGAFSNHLHAVAAAGQRFGFATVGIVRGEDASSNTSVTLKDCAQMGMQLRFVSREAYKQRYQQAYLQEIQQQFPHWMLLPEGGANLLAQKGCAELMDELPSETNVVCVAMGTGTTLLGMASNNQRQLLLEGYPVLKGVEYPEFRNIDHVELRKEFHFGGYAKTSPVLWEFISYFEKQTGIALEQIYTAKMMYGVLDRIVAGAYPRGTTVVAVHSGGLQGRRTATDQ